MQVESRPLSYALASTVATCVRSSAGFLVVPRFVCRSRYWAPYYLLSSAFSVMSVADLSIMNGRGKIHMSLYQVAKAI
ncbi:hypothetical protein V1519DRAFT_453771 [Lipomyces tetrasporus]